MSMKLLPRLLVILLVLVAISALSCGGATAPPEEGEKAVIEFKDTGSKPPMLADTTKKYTAHMETEKGTLVLELFARDVPLTVSNFVSLATQGYYDGTTFHRVIPGFMAQGGDPTGTGAGGPGYRFKDEFTGHKHGTGALSMANAGANTNGSQFFITYAPQPGLDGKHSVFGQLVEGMDVLKSLTPRDPSKNPQFKGDRVIKVSIKVE